MHLKRNIQNVKKNYSLGIIGGGQLALMLAEAANDRDTSWYKEYREKTKCSNGNTQTIIKK